MEERCGSRELLIFVPLPYLTHLVPAIEFANQLINRRPSLSIIFMLLHQPFDPKAHSYARSISSSANSGLEFVHLPEPEPEEEPDSTSSAPISRSSQILQSQTPLVQTAVAAIMDSNSTAKLAGFVIDMFCSAMIDVANVFRVPTYSFYISGAGILDTFHFHSLIQDSDKEGGTTLQDYSDPNLDFKDISIPGYANPVPVKMLPTSFFDKIGLSLLLYHVRRLRETKGIILRTFMEFEFDTINVLLNDPTLPPIYPAGPMINLQGINNQSDQNEHEEEGTIKMMKWLDDQPVSSVVFLCFGSGGSFGETQVKEIAYAVERSGHRFIWSLRPGKKENESSYNQEVLPEGFLQRTSGIGIVAPWVPQARVLSHPSVGGFVTHCGWSSLMEGVYLGVPMAVWPMHSDQQMNAFMLVKELKIAVDMKMDYRLDFKNPNPDIVNAGRIENGIRELMDVANGVNMRARVKEMKEKALMAISEGGSSYLSMASLIEDIFK